MIGMTDYHMHTVLSDGKNSHEEMIQAAIAIGLDEIGFTDHLCLKPVDWAISEVDIPVMTERIEILRERYQDKISVKFGIEMDYLEGREEEISHVIRSLPLDYIIGSVHFIGDWNFDTDKSLYGKWTNDRLYEMYFELIQKAASSGLFDIIGHLDIIKKFRVYPESDQTDLIENTLKIIKEHNLVVELNTGGMDRPCKEFTPSPSIVERCYYHHIPMTLSSDAHRIDQIGRHFETAMILLKKVGFEQLVTFQNRERGILKI